MSYERDKMIGLLARLFKVEDWKWYNDGGYNIPTYEEIEQELDRLEQVAEKEKIVETGRIRIEYDKATQTYDYYLHL